MDPVGAGDNSSPGQPDEQAVFHDPRHRGKPGRKPWRIGDMLQLGVEQPVPAIRDESMAYAGQWGDDLSVDVINRMRAEMKKRGKDI